MSDVRVRLGTRIRQIRLEQGKTQEQLGERAGLSYKQIGEIERGKRNPGLETLEKLAVGLEVPLADLFVPRGEGAYPEISTRNAVVRELKSKLEGALELLNRANRKRAPKRARKRS